MTAEHLLNSLAVRGVTLAVRDGQITARPKGALTDVERQAIRENKSAILPHLAALAAREAPLLAGDGESDPGPSAKPPRRSCFGTCPTCGGVDWIPGTVPLACRECGYEEPLRFGPPRVAT